MEYRTSVSNKNSNSGRDDSSSSSSKPKIIEEIKEGR